MTEEEIEVLAAEPAAVLLDHTGQGNCEVVVVENGKVVKALSGLHPNPVAAWREAAETVRSSS